MFKARIHRSLLVAAARAFRTSSAAPLVACISWVAWSLQTRERIVGRGVIRRGAKKTTIAAYWVKLIKFFDWLVFKGHLESNPLNDGALQFPRIHYDDRKYLDRKDVKKILSAVLATTRWQNHLLRSRNAAIIAVALYCGLQQIA